MALALRFATGSREWSTQWFIYPVFSARSTLPLWRAACVYPKRFNMRRRPTPCLKYQSLPRGVLYRFGCTTCVHPKRLSLRQRSTPRLKYLISPRGVLCRFGVSRACIRSGLVCGDGRRRVNITNFTARGTLPFWYATCVHPTRLNLRRRSTPRLRSPISPRGVLYRFGAQRTCNRSVLICDDEWHRN